MKRITRKQTIYFERRRKKLERRRITTKRKRKIRRWQKYRELKREGQVTKTKFGEIQVKIKQRLDPMQEKTRIIEACKTIRNYVVEGDKKIFIDLSDMEEFTLAGVIFLSASIDGMGMGRLRARSAVRGNLPNKGMVASEFLASGFFDEFKKEGVNLPSPKASWTSAKERKVVSEKAAQLVDFAESKVHIGRRARRAIWQNLVECMTNTHNHAGGQRVMSGNNEDAEKWMAGVMCEENTAHFAFVDLGVGICGSREVQGFLKRVESTLRGYGPERIVRKAFEGELASVTGLPGRGLGLPRMGQHARSGLLENLQIRTGHVAGKVGEMNFRKMSENMPGTVLTWIASGRGRSNQ